MDSTVEQNGSTSIKGEVMEPWTIPFNGVNYVCWRDRKNVPQYRQMTAREEREYFTSDNKEKYLNDLLNK